MSARGRPVRGVAVPELVVHPNQAQHQRVAELAAGLLAEARSPRADHTGFSEVDIAPLSARSPIRRKHVFDTGAYRPSGFRLILCEGGVDIAGAVQKGEGIV